MKFRVVVRKDGVEEPAREIEAASRFVVYEQVQKEGGTVTELTELGRRFALPTWVTHLFVRSIKHAEVARTAKNLSTMLTAGLPLSRALSVIERESDNPHLQTIVASLGAVVSKGSPFHEALAAYPRVFPDLLIAMVKVGEESGSLAESLSIVGLQMEHADELSHKIRGAFIYPCIVVLAIILVSVLMLIYVVPTLTQTFEGLRVQLPLATRIFIAISDFMAAHVILVFIGFALLIAAGTVFVRSRRGLAVLVWTGLHLPVVRELIRETYAARTARTLSSLLSAGVPVLEALTITEEVVHTPRFAAVIAEAALRVKKGEALSSAFAEHAKVYPILMSEMLAVGEETGKVAPMLKQVAEFYEQDVSEKTKDLSTIIEPVLMLLVGAAVGIFAVAMIAPIYSLSSVI